MGENQSLTINDLCKTGVAAVQTGPFGSQLHSCDYVQHGVPVVPTEAILRRRIDLQRANHVAPRTAQRLDRHRLRQGDILFARRGIQATGLSAFVTAEQEGALCGTGAILLRIDRNNLIVDPSFLSFVLATDESIAWFKQHAVGAVMPNLNDSIIKRFPLKLPPLQEQRNIASALQFMEQKIELNRSIDRKLDLTSRMIFKSWFVDFDPVRAKEEGRSPFGIDTELSALFAFRVGPSPIGAIPNGWTPGTLQDIGDVTTESVAPGREEETIWEHYSIPAFDARHQPASELGASIKSNKFRVPSNAILLSKLNPETPRIWMPDVRRPSVAICSTEFIPVVPKHVSWRSFLYELLRSEPVQSEIVGRATGSTGSRQRVRPGEIVRIRCAIPPLDLIEASSSLLRPLHNQQMQQFRESVALASLRDLLLPKLISGEVRLKYAEKELAAI